MKPRYWQSGAESHAQNRWMVSYLDVLTILLVFFIGVAARALQPAAVQPPGKPAAVKPAADEPASDEPVPAKAAMNQPVPPLLESPPQPPAAAPVQASAALDRAQQQLAQEDGLTVLKPVKTFEEKATVKDALDHFKAEHVLLVRGPTRGSLLGILTAFDLL